MWGWDTARFWQWKRIGIAAVVALFFGVVLVIFEWSNRQQIFNYENEADGGHQIWFYKGDQRISYKAYGSDPVWNSYPCKEIFTLIIGSKAWEELVAQCGIVAQEDNGPVQNFTMASRIAFWPFGVGSWLFGKFDEMINSEAGAKINRALYPYAKQVSQRCSERYFERHRSDPDFSAWSESIQEDAAKFACNDVAKNQFKVFVGLFILLPLVVILPGIISWLWLTLLAYVIFVIAHRTAHIFQRNK